MKQAGVRIAVPVMKKCVAKGGSIVYIIYIVRQIRENNVIAAVHIHFVDRVIFVI